MGLALWLSAGVAAVILARIVPLARPRNPLAEVIGAILAALVAGLAATALDFGGWREADWRAALFAFLVAAAAIGLVRLRPA
ncbi:MAG TPA: hypothetical protein VGR02_00865 [Thermoanaerobaculia bacterium]|jgi:hypothetical protein|nr:hypothetical protein [Thermoanaerobaculia bacterium]